MLGGGSGLGRIYELLNFSFLLVDFGQMLGAEFLVSFEFLLRKVLFSEMHIVGSQAEMRVG